MKKIIISLATLLVSMGNFYAQSGGNSNQDVFLPKIIPPSPTAYSLGNYGNVPVGLFTGAPSISIPLFTYKTNNIDLPFHLSYGSNGMKVDQVSSNVGLGWDLNYGGVITRMVKGLPDELHTYDFVPDNVNGGMTNTVALQFYQNAGNSTNYDTQRDVYSFNFNGVSGKFFYDRNQQPHLIDQQAIKIERIASVGTNGKDFLLTLPTGEKYYFTEKETTMYRSVGAGHSIPQASITAWYLTKIVHPKGDEIYFTYETSNIPNYTASESQTLKMTFPYVQHIPGDPNPVMQSPTMGLIQQNNTQILGSRIKTISSNNSSNGTVTFTYTTDFNVVDIDGNYKIQNITWQGQNNVVIETTNFNYLNTINKRNFLGSIVFKDPSKSYSFDYESPSSFPIRLSHSQDYWGYYNGKTNTNLVPKNIPNDDYNLSNYNYNGADKKSDPNFTKIGLLKKIIYPTKGYTELEYEGNTYWGEKTVYPPVTNNEFDVANPTVGTVKQDYTFISAIDQKITISGNCIYYNPQNPNPAGGPTHNPSGYVSLVTDDTMAAFYTWSQSSGQHYLDNHTFADFYTPETQTIYFDAKAGKSYKLTFAAKRETSTIYNLLYYPTAPQIFNTNLDTGGVRIKSTKDYDGVSANPKYQRYYYGTKDDLNHSSGDKGYDPVYIDNILQTVDHGNYQGTANFLAVTSSSVMSMYDNNSSCFYKNVTISNGGDNFERGGETKEFIVDRDYPGNAVWGTNFQSAPWANISWDNGLEVKSQVISKDTNSQVLNILTQKENIYDQNESSKYQINNYAFRLRYEYPFQQSTTKVCTADDIAKVYHNYVCTTNHNHEWWMGSNHATCIAPGANNVDQLQYDKCHGHAVGDVVSYPYTLNNLDVMEYKNYSYWHYLKSQKITEYLDGAPVVTQTEYFYDNPSNYQLNRQKVTFSDTSYNETLYNYAHEKGNQLMIDKNMISIPLETTTTKTIGTTTKTLSKTETIYPISQSEADTKTSGLVLPYTVFSTDLQNNQAAEITYDKYDLKGNLQQYTTKDGIPVTIIWGYNQTQPIAKIEGAKLSDIQQSFIDSIVNASDTDALAISNNDEALFSSVLNAFKNNLPNYQVSTYTYDPLIGVRSITPSSGIREVYIYDTANRLKEIRENDATGKLLKEFKYNYKN